MPVQLLYRRKARAATYDALCAPCRPCGMSANAAVRPLPCVLRRVAARRAPAPAACARAAFPAAAASPQLAALAPRARRTRSRAMAATPAHGARRARALRRSALRRFAGLSPGWRSPRRLWPRLRLTGATHARPDPPTH